MTTLTESAMMQMCRIAIESNNYLETATILKKRFNLPQNLTSIRKWVSITKQLAKRDDIEAADLLELVSQTKNGNGDVTSERYAIRPTEPDLKGLKLKAVSKSHHTVWEKYALDDKFDVSFFTDEYIGTITEKLKTIEPVTIPQLKKHNQKNIDACIIR